jgi:hypothetical protein
MVRDAVEAAVKVREKVAAIIRDDRPTFIELTKDNGDQLDWRSRA